MLRSDRRKHTVTRWTMDKAGKFVRDDKQPEPTYVYRKPYRAVGPDTTITDFEASRKKEPMSGRELDTLTEELGERAASDLVAENLPFCREGVVKLRIEEAGPTRLIGTVVVDFADMVFDVEGWDAKEGAWAGSTVVDGGTLKEYWIPPNCIKEVVR